jgi:hypothetical protein
MTSVSGKDAKAIAEYAIDLKKKFKDINELKIREDLKARTEAEQFDRSRIVSPLQSRSYTESTGIGLGTSGVMPNSLPSSKAIAEQWGITKRELEKGKGQLKTAPQSIVNQFSPGKNPLDKDGKYIPTGPFGQPIEGPSYLNKKLINKQPLTTMGAGIGGAWGITLQELLGKGRGQYSAIPAYSTFLEHPSMQDVSKNAKGFAAMEACWVEYITKYLPKYGIDIKSLSITVSADKIKGEFASTVKRNILAELSTPPEIKKDTTPPENIKAEENFYYSVFLEVENRLRGESGTEGASLKGVVKKAALTYLSAEAVSSGSIMKTVGTAAGGAITPVMQGVAGAIDKKVGPNLFTNPILYPKYKSP